MSDNVDKNSQNNESVSNSDFFLTNFGYILTLCFGLAVCFQIFIQSAEWIMVINVIFFILSIPLGFAIRQYLENKLKLQKILKNQLLKLNEELEDKIIVESRKKYQELIDCLPQTVYELDENFRLIFSNKKAFEIFGLEADAVEKKINVVQLFAPEDQQKMISSLKFRMQSGMLAPMEYSILRKDGTRIPVMIYGSPVVKDGQIAGTRGIIVDISERKAMEKALRKSEERYKKLIGSLQEGLFVIQDGKFTFLNDAIVKIVGYTVEELYGKDFLTVIAGESKDMVANNHYKRVNGIESPDHYKTFLLHKNGDSIPVILSVVLSDYEGKPAVIGTAKDISDWK